MRSRRLRNVRFLLLAFHRSASLHPAAQNPKEFFGERDPLHAFIRDEPVVEGADRDFAGVRGGRAVAVVPCGVNKLNLTPSAVAHRKMEEALGLLLFERVGRGVALSSEGRRYWATSSAGLMKFYGVWTRSPPVHRGSFGFIAHRALQLAQHSDVEVRRPPASTTDVSTTGEFDADLMYGHPRQEGLVVLPLKEETVTPLCAPHLAREIESPADPSERRAPLRAFALWLARELNITFTHFC